MKIKPVPLLLLFFTAICVASCARRFPKHFSVWRLTASDRQIWKSFAEAPVQPTIFYFRSGGRTLRGWSVGADSLPVTLLLHGAPSSMVKYRAWFRDTSFFGKTQLVAVDRPGYGKSGYGKAEVSVVRQAALLAPLLRKLAERGPVVLCGSSYGGSVAAKLAMDYPECVAALVLQSASVLPNAERTPRIARWIHSPLGIVFPKWARVSTKEKYAHTRALEAIQDGWGRIRCPVWVIHGQQDDLIYPSNAEHVVRQLAPHTEVHYIPIDSARHNIYWTRRDTVKHYILKAVKFSRYNS